MILDENPSPEVLLAAIEEDDELMHYGTKFHSGRYPYGSGEDPYQHSGDFVSRCQELRKSGLSDKEISKHFGMSLQDYRDEYRVANNTRKLLEIDRIKNLKEKGYSNYKIAEMMGYPNESTVRGKLKPHFVARLQEAQNTCDFLKERIQEKRFIDVGKGAERYLNVTRDKLDEAVYMMRMEGYKVYKAQRDQPTNPGKKTTLQIVGMPDTDNQEFYKKLDNAEIQSIKEFKSSDGGQTFQPKFVYPASLDSKRLMVRPAEEGGAEKDGVIELRRGVKDLDLGDSRYAQVRILVDNSHYLKGMASYSDDMPDGVDVIFNSNKSIVDKPNKLDHLKSIDKHIKVDPNNPFGTTIKDMEEGGQYYYDDGNGNMKLGLINKKSNAGDWSEWSNALPSQFLAKQPLSLAKKQIDLALERRKTDFEEICALTNPTIKKKLLDDFAGDCDSAAVHLKAASLPRQQYHAIYPINTLKETEVYAPNYEDGEKVALVRFPHAGTFEIPILTVNNKNKLAVDVLGKDAVDAVGINYKVGEQLSGADFDGDTVMVIPMKGNNIKATPMLRDLEGFDPKIRYATRKKVVNGVEKYYDENDVEVKIMKNTNTEMGVISNLITDMTLRGAPPSDIAKAVKHSMVVIDAEKHKLNYKQSEKDNDIKTLKQRWQDGGGASTLISQAKSVEYITKTQGAPKYNKKGTPDYDPTKPEGALLYKEHKDAYAAEWFVDKDNPDIRGYVLANGKGKVTFNKNNKDEVEYYRPVKKYDKDGKPYFTNKTGELVYNHTVKQQKITKMANTDDAYTLVSKARAPMELLYADYANKLKSLANEARKEYLYTSETKRDPNAAKIYEEEVKALESKLELSLSNAPRERMAVILANSEIKGKQDSNPDISPKELKKLRDQAMKRARETVGAKRHPIDITDKEWEAIQAGAITKTKLWEILRFADMDVLRAKAMPHDTTKISDTQRAKIVAKYKSGKLTYAQLADSAGVSKSTVINLLKQEGLL